MEVKPFYLKWRLYANIILAIAAFFAAKWPVVSSVVNEVTLGVAFTFINTLFTIFKKPTLEA